MWSRQPAAQLFSVFSLPVLKDCRPNHGLVIVRRNGKKAVRPRGRAGAARLQESDYPRFLTCTKGNPVVTGLVSNEELATRSSTGYFEFCPPGANERLIRQAGFKLVRTEEVTENEVEVRAAGTPHGNGVRPN